MKRAFCLLILVGLLGSAPRLSAEPSFLRKAKKMGLPGITNCQACHVSTKKGNIVWNERGLWLREKKKELGVRRVDVSWLKDYQPAP